VNLIMQSFRRTTIGHLAQLPDDLIADDPIEADWQLVTGWLEHNLPSRQNPPQFRHPVHKGLEVQYLTSDLQIRSRVTIMPPQAGVITISLRNEYDEVQWRLEVTADEAKTYDLYLAIMSLASYPLAA
jgi:hypothetical protein